MSKSKAVKTIEDTLSEYSNWVTFSDSFYNLNILIGFPYASTLFNPSTAQLGKIIRENLLFQINLPVTIVVQLSRQKSKLFIMN